jgi:CDP-glycerol glycerophosphotransferase (TagB/SpsB family)
VSEMDNIYITDENYEKLFEIGSVLISDYSSVTFDFAYLKKPVLYYHVFEPNYVQTYFNYDTMGFGEIAHTVDELVDAVENVIKNGCQMEAKYQNRVDDFFAFNDTNNSQRVYDEIIKIPGFSGVSANES